MTDAGRVPRGIEQLLTLAAMNAEWHGKVLADPPAAAPRRGLVMFFPCNLFVPSGV